MQIFNLFDNQHGTFTANPVDVAGNPSTVSSESITVDSPDLLRLSATAFANQMEIRATGQVGTATITVTGTNSDGALISSQFAVVISLSPATSFMGSMAGVGTN